MTVTMSCSSRDEEIKAIGVRVSYIAISATTVKQTNPTSVQSFSSLWLSLPSYFCRLVPVCSMEFTIKPCRLFFGSTVGAPTIRREVLSDRASDAQNTKDPMFHEVETENTPATTAGAPEGKTRSNGRRSRQGSPLSDVNGTVTEEFAMATPNSVMNIDASYSEKDLQSNTNHKKTGGAKTEAISPVSFRSPSQNTPTDVYNDQSTSDMEESAHNSDLSMSFHPSPSMSMDEDYFESGSGSEPIHSSRDDNSVDDNRDWSRPGHEEERRFSSAPAEEDPEAASIALARLLMQQESMMVYSQMQDQAMAAAASRDESNGADNDGDSDLMYALELARQEQAAGALELEEDSIDPDEMDYEALMELGEQMGDVAQDRWRMDARKHMESFPITKITAKFLEHIEGNAGLCQVCQCEYEEDEEMKTLPCKHHFHPECIDQWLKDHPTCCICKRSVLDAEDKVSAAITSEQGIEDRKLPAGTFDSHTSSRIVRSPST